MKRAYVMAALLAATLQLPRMCGAHLCRADQASSEVRTAESRQRSDIEPPPAWFALIEANDADALAEALPDSGLTAAGTMGPAIRGLYRLEFDLVKPGPES